MWERMQVKTSTSFKCPLFQALLFPLSKRFPSADNWNVVVYSELAARVVPQPRRLRDSWRGWWEWPCWELVGVCVCKAVCVLRQCCRYLKTLLMNRLWCAKLSGTCVPASQSMILPECQLFSKLRDGRHKDSIKSIIGWVISWAFLMHLC